MKLDGHWVGLLIPKLGRDDKVCLGDNGVPWAETKHLCKETVVHTEDILLEFGAKWST